LHPNSTLDLGGTEATDAVGKIWLQSASS